VSGDPAKLKKLSKGYGAPIAVGYDNFDRVLADVDAVYIATPNSEHADLAVRAARAGKHVLCEKPLAVTTAECDRIVAAFRAQGVYLMTAYRLHFDPITLEVLRHVRRRHLGELRYFSASFSMRVKPGNIRTRRETGGGTMYDIGIYCINGARMLFNAEPVSVSAQSINGARSGMPTVDDTTSAILRFEGDRLAALTCSFDAADVSAYRIVGTRGSILVSPAFEYAEPLAYTMTTAKGSRTRRGRKIDQFAGELLYFSDCILNSRKPEPSGEEGAEDVRIIEAIYESAHLGKTVALGAARPEAGPTSRQRHAEPPVSRPSLVHARGPHR
jgi:glucose-fructose oxidoreductase